MGSVGGMWWLHPPSSKPIPTSAAFGYDVGTTDYTWNLCCGLTEQHKVGRIENSRARQLSKRPDTANDGGGPDESPVAYLEFFVVLPTDSVRCCYFQRRRRELDIQTGVAELTSRIPPQQ